MKRVALIGVGKMGLSHLAIANQTSGIKVEAICDTSAPLLRMLEKNTGFKCYSDYRKMIEDVDLDGALICVPNAYHFEIAQRCIESGISIFVEKPLTLSSRESRALADMCRVRGVKGQAGYVNRFNPVFQRVKSMIDQQAIGTVTGYKNQMIGGVILKEGNKGWRNDYEKGGGCLFDYGPHCFDLSTFFFGDRARVQSSVLKKIFSTRVDDMVCATLVHDEKVVGINYINWSDSSVRKASNIIEISGTNGKITANKQEANIYLNEAHASLNLEKGWNQLFITDQNTDVGYYLRGEDFSRQLQEFSNLLNGKIEESISSLESASVVDKLLEEAHDLSASL